MFSGNYFYHKIVRRCTSVFGSLFNNIKIRNVDQNGNLIKESKVPLQYGPRNKQLERIKREEDLDTQQRVAIQLPRMSFEITSLNYDAETATTMLRRVSHKMDDTNMPFRTSSRTFTPAPYKLGMQLNVYSRQQDEILQILEQILPYFRPDFMVTVKHFDGAETVWDMPITLTSVSIDDAYTGDTSENMVTIYTLDFEILVRFFGPVSDQGVITKVIANIKDIDGDPQYSQIEIEAVPTSPSETGYIITSTITDFYGQ